MTATLNSCGERLKYLRKITRLSRAQLCYKYGISANSLKFWESSDKEFSESLINKFMEIYKDQGIIFNRDWLIYGSGLAPKPLSEIRKSLITPVSEINTNNEEDFNNNIENTAILKEINLFKEIYPDHAIMIVSNNDMLPFYKMGDYVFGRWIFNDNIKKAINQDCIVRLVDGGKYFRRLIQDDKGLFNIACLNPSGTKYQPVLYNIAIESVAPVIWHRKVY